jgi:hypothetical protein
MTQTKPPKSALPNNKNTRDKRKTRSYFDKLVQNILEISNSADNPHKEYSKIFKKEDIQKAKLISYIVQSSAVYTSTKIGHPTSNISEQRIEEIYKIVTTHPKKDTAKTVGTNLHPNMIRYTIKEILKRDPNDIDYLVEFQHLPDYSTPDDFIEWLEVEKKISKNLEPVIRGYAEDKLNEFAEYLGRVTLTKKEYNELLRKADITNKQSIKN